VSKPRIVDPAQGECTLHHTPQTPNLNTEPETKPHRGFGGRTPPLGPASGGLGTHNSKPLSSEVEKRVSTRLWPWLRHFSGHSFETLLGCSPLTLQQDGRHDSAPRAPPLGSLSRRRLESTLARHKSQTGNPEQTLTAGRVGARGPDRAPPRWPQSPRAS